MKAARQINARSFSMAALASLCVLTGCTAVAQSPDESAPSNTVGGVGALPHLTGTEPVTVAETASVPVPTNESVVEADATDSTGPVTSSGDGADTTTPATTASSLFPIGSRTTGNRVLMIGDSVTASISERYGGQACDALVPLGWKVEVDAETGRSIDFGKIVLDKRLDAGWDAVIINLGTNYGENQAVYKDWLHALVERLAPRPTVLINSSLFRPEQQEVNDVISYVAAAYPNVAVIDWAALASADPELTGKDEIHLTEKGRRTLAYQLAIAMGTAPIQPGECLKTAFRDDSAGSPDGPPDNTTKPKPKPTSTTVKPTATTTKPPTSSTPSNTTQSTTTPTTSGNSPPAVTTTTSPPTTAAPTTAAPTTAATIPPTTAAPTTAAPTTAAPTIPTVPTTIGDAD